MYVEIIKHTFNSLLIVQSDVKTREISLFIQFLLQVNIILNYKVYGL